MKSYSSLRLTNVEATKQLAALAQLRNTLFYFVSSASVMQVAELDEIGEVSVANHHPGPDTDGYVAAKWVSERHLEKVKEKLGLPIWFHRPSSIMGEGTNDLDLMKNIFNYIELLEAVPTSESLKGYFDFVSVNSVAASIVKAVNTGGFKGVKYQFEAGDIVYPLSTMEEMLNLGSDLPVKTIPLLDWVDAAEEKGLNQMVAEYLRPAAATNSPLAFPKLVKGKRT